MDGLTCDVCDEGLLLDVDVRYILKVEGYAAYDPMELTRQDLEKDVEAEMRGVLRQLETKDGDEAQDEVHRAFSYDLCPRCWKRYLRDPLASAREQEA